MLRFSPSQHRSPPSLANLKTAPVLLSASYSSRSVVVNHTATVLPTRPGKKVAPGGLSFSQVRQAPALFGAKRFVTLSSPAVAQGVLVGAPAPALAWSPKQRPPQPATGPRLLFFEDSQKRLAPNLKLSAFARPALFQPPEPEVKPREMKFSDELPSDPYRGGAVLEVPKKPSITKPPKEAPTQKGALGGYAWLIALFALLSFVWMLSRLP